ncbi:FxLYD domain-containing protein [Patescibacteria group bacterium]|nr:FxLYD domain-containing protein [Patescibacteria group bacterium]
MHKRTLKRIVIALVFLSILAAIVFLVYFLNRPAPTCSDGVKNQSEEDIDCGGPCSSCELLEIKDIEVLSTKSVSTQNDFYGLMAQVKNPNQNYGSGKVPFTFKIYDSSGDLIIQSSGQTYILPNQTKYIIKPKVDVNRSPGKVEISFGKIEWEKLINYQAPSLPIQQKEYRLLDYRESGFSQAKGILVNKSNFDFSRIDLDILLFDSFGRLIGLNTTEVNILLSGQARDFIATWFDEIDGQVAVIEIEAETNIFDKDNYLPTGQGIPEKFQEY